jgi:5-(carboxyamino)imidazole ribonucleotide synthase
LGGGQLGKMIAIEARRMGYRVKVLDPDTACPAAEVAEVVQGEWSDPTAALELALACDVLTLETEHVPYAVLAQVERVRTLRPSADVLRTIQDRYNQRHFLHRHDLPQTRWANVEDLTQLRAALADIGVPAILKRRTGGYDGRAQVRMYAADEAQAAWTALGEAPCILESFVDFTAELSVVLARSAQGEIRFFATAENVHQHGILHTTVAPARFSPAIRTWAEDLATRAAVALELVGVLTVEYFLTRDDTLLINEMAPRVHNSGHVTLGACVTSQFEQQLRAVCGLPLGSQHQHAPAAMVNLLGDLWAKGEPNFMAVLAEPRAHLHLYGKRAARPGRKMGHITVLSDDTDEALAVAQRLHAQLVERAGL